MIRPRKFRTKEARKKERVRVALRLSGLVVACGMLVGLIGYGLRHPVLRIQHITFSSDGILQPGELEGVARDMLAGAYVGIVPKDVSWLVQTDAIAEKMRARFPRIQTIDVSRMGVQGIQGTVQERTPAALWCGDIVPPQSEMGYEAGDVSGTCYLSDKEGFVYDKAPTYSGESFLRYYGSLLRAEPIGEHIAPPEEFARWQQFVADMRADDTLIRALLFVDERDVELYLLDGLRLIVPRAGNLETLRGRISAIRTSDTIDTSRAVSYLDMRFGAKVFVKYADTPEAVDARIEGEDAAPESTPTEQLQ